MSFPAPPDQTTSYLALLKFLTLVLSGAFLLKFIITLFVKKLALVKVDIISITIVFLTLAIMLRRERLFGLIAATVLSIIIFVLFLVFDKVTHPLKPWKSFLLVYIFLGAMYMLLSSQPFLDFLRLYNLI